MIKFTNYYYQMQNLILPFLVLFLSISFGLKAQDYPHDYAGATEMGVEENVLFLMCEHCVHEYKPHSKLPIKIFEEVIWSSTRGSLPLKEQLDSIPSLVKEEWLETCRFLTCRFSIGRYDFGPMDFLSVRFGQKGEYLKLYDPKGPYRLSPDFVRVLTVGSWRFEGTLLDYVELLINDNPEYQEHASWVEIRELLLGYGAKRLSELE